MAICSVCWKLKQILPFIPIQSASAPEIVGGVSESVRIIRSEFHTPQAYDPPCAPENDSARYDFGKISFVPFLSRKEKEEHNKVSLSGNLPSALENKVSLRDSRSEAWQSASASKIKKDSPQN